ncbi:MAG TPA: membrane protein insertion efficiency factor YidD [Alphaproteobacteria bacterium]|nr:membrane protein insertion efficiency factor YidD [Alphaproteobacteria bacterium]
MAGTIRMVSGLAGYGLIALVWGYRLLLAPLFPASCRYNPSCSAYAIEAIRRHGPIKGAWLAGRRLLACHPWGDCGHDPVPEDFRYRDLFALRRGRP